MRPSRNRPAYYQVGVVAGSAFLILVTGSHSLASLARAPLLTLQPKQQRTLSTTTLRRPLARHRRRHHHRSSVYSLVASYTGTCPIVVAWSHLHRHPVVLCHLVRGWIAVSLTTPPLPSILSSRSKPTCIRRIPGGLFLLQSRFRLVFPCATPQWMVPMLEVIPR